MKKSNIFHYWMALTYMGVLVLFLVVSIFVGGFLEANAFGVSALAMSAMTSSTSSSPPIIVFVVLMILEPIMISGLLLLLQYRSGDLQNRRTATFFSVVVTMCYYVFASASWFCSGKFCEAIAFLLGMPGIYLLFIPFSFLLTGAPVASNSFGIVTPLIIAFFMIPNAILLFCITRLVLKRKAKKELEKLMAVGKK